MRPFRLVAELTTDQPEKFAVISVDPTERHEDGGCVGTVLSLHRTREEADQAAGAA
jgi:putative protein kinase ArgK-like GTPase of G3E family